MVEALSLLYRGALACLVRDHSLGIDESATEGDCLAAVRRVGGPEPFAEGLRRLEGPGGEPPKPAEGKAAERAMVLARLGLGAEAREELDHGELGGWRKRLLRTGSAVLLLPLADACPSGVGLIC